MAKSLAKAKAIRLRRQGYSYNVICKKLKVAKSTCSVWLRKVKLDAKAIQRLVDRQDRGRVRAALTLRQYRREIDKYIKLKVKQSLKSLRVTPQLRKVVCASLYWAEGHKDDRSVSFTNSDHRMIRTFLQLFRIGFVVDNKKLHAWLHLHEYHNIEKQKIFWSKITRIPFDRIHVYQKPNSGKNIREGYPGCICTVWLCKASQRAEISL